MRKIPIPASGHDMRKNEGYGNYMVRLTERMAKKALELKAEGELIQSKGNICDFEVLNESIKDEVEKLVSVIYERDHIMD